MEKPAQDSRQWLGSKDPQLNTLPDLFHFFKMITKANKFFLRPNSELCICRQLRNFVQLRSKGQTK